MEHKMEESWAAMVHDFIYWVGSNGWETSDAGREIGFPSLHRAMPECGSKQNVLKNTKYQVYSRTL